MLGAGLNMISVYSNKAVLSLLNMINEMYRKDIEIRRITKTCTLLLMSGLSRYDIPHCIIEKCLKSQNKDGGFIGNSDTIWNIKFLEFFPEYSNERLRALKWLTSNNGSIAGYGRSKRDIHRIPVTGIALYLIPELVNKSNVEWLELTWTSEINSLTYKAAYTILAFNSSRFNPIYDKNIINSTAEWLVSQQAANGGYGPWLDHPVGENVYCTSVVILALISMFDEKYDSVIKAGYDYLCNTQLKSGIWPYHEIEDGASWGLFALSKAEDYLEGKV